MTWDTTLPGFSNAFCPSTRKLIDHGNRVFSDATEGPKELEYRIRHVDGSLRWLRTRAFPFHEGGDDSPVMVAGITEDITERVTIAESGIRLREFERLLQSCARRAA